MYNQNSTVILCSDFMNSEEYKDIFEDVCRKVGGDPILSERVLATVPVNKRYLGSAKDYPVHELVCVKYLSENGYQLKIGPKKEEVYDEIMQDLNFEINFSYILSAYALGTKFPDEVVHYIPQSRGPNNGQRIFFGDSERAITQKLQQGCDEALRYFCKIAYVSGCLLGRGDLINEDVQSLFGKKLKKKTIKLVFENIIQPYREVEPDGF